jgi:hypothetical protein
MKMAVFWVVAPCSLVGVYRRFRGGCRLYHQSPPSPGRLSLIALVMEAASTSETSENFYQTTRRNNQEGNHLQPQCCV